MDKYKETMPSDAPAARASSFDFADFAAKRPRRPGASMRRSVLRTALSWICTKKPTGNMPVGPNHKIFGVTPERRTTRLTPSSLARWETSRMPL